MLLGVSPQGILLAAPHHGSAPLHPIGFIGLPPSALALLQGAEGREEAHSGAEGVCYPIQ